MYLLYKRLTYKPSVTSPEKLALSVRCRAFLQMMNMAWYFPTLYHKFDRAGLWHPRSVGLPGHIMRHPTSLLQVVYVAENKYINTHLFCHDLAPWYHGSQGRLMDDPILMPSISMTVRFWSIFFETQIIHIPMYSFKPAESWKFIIPLFFGQNHLAWIDHVSSVLAYR